MKIFLFCFLLLNCFSVNRSGEDDSCCQKSSGSCRRACEQMSLTGISANPNLREESLVTLHNFCSMQMKDFWLCMNSTLKEIKKGEEWFGRRCCLLPQTERCRKACVMATSRQNLTLNCRQSDEIIFFECLDKQENGEKCCANARSADCFEACKNVFQTRLTPSSETRKSVIEYCSGTSPKVVNCIKNFTRVTPVTNVHKFLHCCEESNEDRCVETCRQVLKPKTTIQEIIDKLQEKGCGPPLPDNKFWQCFLHAGAAVKNSDSSVSASRIDQIGIDSAKLHCCKKASSIACSRLCFKTFSDDWVQSWKNFDRQCLSDIREADLLQCLEEVDQPCELGCHDLSYCTNFNNRPTELFRSCNSQADEAAKSDVELWQQQGFFNLSGGIKIIIKNTSKCSWDLWKSVACLLQIKPCHRQSHSNRICSEDCYEILDECIDWSNMPSSQTSASICSKFSSKKQSSTCISLKPYLEPGYHSYLKLEREIRAPCKEDPCEPNEICLINRYCPSGKSCLPYSCKPGCRLGEVSQYVIPYDSYVRIPFPEENKECQKICYCSRERTIESCQVLPCVPFESCWLGKEKIEHGFSFFMDCNLCSCLFGEITCSKKHCQGNMVNMNGHFTASSFTSLPCHCLPHHVPVCGKNGYTYPNMCLAKCSGLKEGDFEFGPCSAKNACDSSPCGEGFKCIPLRKVCLSLLEKPCKQYICVDVTLTCSEISYNPVCDVEQKEHDNLCHLVKAKKLLAYVGPCLTDCRNDGPVCGIDGETYRSECSAMANLVLVDYRGSCLSVGLISNEPKAQCGLAVACPELPSTGCYAVTPPGACCPICAGALRLLFSRKQVDRALYSLRSIPTNSLTVSGILTSLQRQIQTVGCSLWGYLTVELDIFVAVLPQHVNKNKQNEYLEREICIREAEKLATMIQRANPRILSDLGLSSITGATMVHIFVNLGCQFRSPVLVWTVTVLFHMVL